MFSLTRKYLSTRSKDAGRISGRLQTIWIEPIYVREESDVEISSKQGTRETSFSNPYLTLVKYTYHNPVVETEPKVCELNRRIELLRKQQKYT